MAGISRRYFLGSSLAAAGAVTLTGRRAQAKPGANGKIRIAVVGLNGRGHSHTQEYAKMDDVEIAYLVDPDSRTFDAHVKSIQGAKEKAGKEYKAPQTAKDIRKVLEDKNLDAISIATPNHWHSLMTIWGLQAGKHVYVEKPMCHNIMEGEAAVAAAKRYGKVVQHGTQQRSEPSWARTVAAIRSGQLGKTLVIRGLCYKDGGTGGSTRGDIGFKPVTTPPKEIDFDLWLGPAPRQGYHENIVHYRWHWFWDFGNGDLGNQGVHQMDMCHWCLPEGATFPDSVISAGGRFTKNKDQAQTPNEIISIYDYNGITVIFETRGNPTKQLHGVGVGNIIDMEAGQIRAGTRNPQFFPRENGKLAEKPAPMPEVELPVTPGGAFGSFINAVKADDPAKANAPASVAWHSSSLCHLGNASYVAGKPTKFDKSSKKFDGNEAATETFARLEEHLVKSGVSLETGEYVLGKKLSLAKGSWKTDDQKANDYLAGAKQYRPGFTIPSDLLARS